jgi:hypothetical protein
MICGLQLADKTAAFWIIIWVSIGFVRSHFDIFRPALKSLIKYLISILYIVSIDLSLIIFI